MMRRFRRFTDLRQVTSTRSLQDAASIWQFDGPDRILSAVAAQIDMPETALRKSRGISKSRRR